MIKQYFEGRIHEVTVHEMIALPQTMPIHTIRKEEVLVIKTTSNRLKVVFAYIPALRALLKKYPFHHWDSKNKWHSIPYSEQIVEELKAKIAELKLIYIFKQDSVKTDGLKRITPYDIPNYKACPGEYIAKLTELRYSTNTLLTYSRLFEEFINYYNTDDFKTLDETQVIQFLRYLVTVRKVSTSYQNQSINSIKFYRNFRC